MKQFLILIVFFCSLSNVSSQCEPEDGFPLDKVALYPLPFGVIPIEEGGTGIVDTAFIGEMFDMTFTMVFPDTFLDPSTNSLTIGDTLLIIPDSTRFVFNEEDLDGFPEGLALEVNPETPVLGSREGPVGCVRLFGMPTADVAPGDYTIFFGARSCVQNPTFTGCINIEIPSLFTGILGEYKLTIADRTSSTLELLNDKQNLTLAPNPFSETAEIRFNTSGMSGQYRLQITDLSGRLIHSESIGIKSDNQLITIDSQDWMNGVYIFQLSGQEGQLAGRMIKQN